MIRKRKIAILGSTGSIGRQALEVVEQHPDLFSAEVLIAGKNVGLLIEQALKFRPSRAIIADSNKFAELRDALAPAGIKVDAGEDAIADTIRDSDEFDILLNSTVGYSGLRPTIAAIEGGKDIALANKESLVVAGSLVRKKLESSSVSLNPVDSEHSAIWQCLSGEDRRKVRRLIITASGGPFRTYSSDQIARASVKDALHHPNWSMGAKITIDSATMMNKAFEIIEAHWLFGVSPDRIEAVVHPQSIVHSMVEFCDGAVIAQLGVPDMRLPIRYALGDATRLDAPDEKLDLLAHSPLTFEKPDIERFPCLGLARKALAKGGTEACAINAANEVAVAAFLSERIGFTDIYPLICRTAEKVAFIENPQYDDFVSVNREARLIAEDIIRNKNI